MNDKGRVAERLTATVVIVGTFFFAFNLVETRCEILVIRRKKKKERE